MFRIGTRGSRLALYQCELVKAKLEQAFPLYPFELVKIKTSGDMIRRSAADPFLTKRVYTREIEEALLKREIDMGVHSAKDMAAELPGKLKIGAVLEREDPRDCLVSREGKKLDELYNGARVATSAVRRKLQILRLRPDLIIEEIHGNVDTRIKKFEEGDVDALILAYAGLKRLGLTGSVTEVFAEESFLPAPCQGAIAVEIRENDPQMEEFMHGLNHEPSFFRVRCERAFLKHLEGGCQLPCGITTSLEKPGRIFARGILFSMDGKQSVEAEVETPLGNPEHTGIQLGDEILEKGGYEILKRMRG